MFSVISEMNIKLWSLNEENEKSLWNNMYQVPRKERGTTIRGNTVILLSPNIQIPVIHNIPGDDPCANNNGGCSDICHPGPGGTAECSCPDFSGTKIGNNDKMCIPINNNCTQDQFICRYFVWHVICDLVLNQFIVNLDRHKVDNGVERDIGYNWCLTCIWTLTWSLTFHDIKWRHDPIWSLAVKIWDW